MKGIVFREFLDLVEDRFGLEIADRMIAESRIVTNGAYVATGTYDHGEMLSMVASLSHHTKIEAGELVKVYGQHLFAKLMGLAAGLTEVKQQGLYAFLGSIENKIHVDVRKIHPDAELPSFLTSRPNDGVLVLEYRSARPFADLAEGLIRGAIDYFAEPVSLQREDAGSQDGTAATFVLRKD